MIPSGSITEVCGRLKPPWSRYRASLTEFNACSTLDFERFVSFFETSVVNFIEFASWDASSTHCGSCLTVVRTS